jgi:hypothetical protein
MEQIKQLCILIVFFTKYKQTVQFLILEVLKIYSQIPILLKHKGSMRKM